MCDRCTVALRQISRLPTALSHFFLEDGVQLAMDTVKLIADEALDFHGKDFQTSSDRDLRSGIVSENVKQELVPRRQA